MFFIMGISQGSKEFGFTQGAVCRACGRSGQYIVFMTYTVLTLFFIPVFKWNRQYFVRMSCCGTTYRLDPEVGKVIARGGQVEIQPQDLQDADGGAAGWSEPVYSAAQQGQSGQPESAAQQADVNPWTNAPADKKVCSHCGYEAAPDFDFCPKCGNKL